MGRPTTIGNHKLTWSKKGKLIGYDDIVYTYSLNGIRTSKIVTGVKTTYFILNNKIIAEKSAGKEIIYRYSSDKLIGFAFNGVEYIYERNIQGDVLRIYRKDNLTLVAEYQYDAYGNHKVINHTEDNIGDINPFRYRGYYFDVETGWYYLNARYYSPAMGRFISPDELSILDKTKSQINGLNLYMYCGDNPIMNVDPSGRDWWADLWKGIAAFVIGAVVVTAITLVSIATAGTAVPALVGAGIGFISSGAISFVSEGMQCGWDMSKFNYGNVLSSAAFGMVGGAFGGAGLSAIQLAGVNAGLNFAETFIDGMVSGNDLFQTLFASTIGGIIGGVTGLIGGNGALYDRSGIVSKGFSYLTKESPDIFMAAFYRIAGAALFPTSSIVKSMLKKIPSTFGYTFLNYLYSDMLS